MTFLQVSPDTILDIDLFYKIQMNNDTKSISFLPNTGEGDLRDIAMATIVEYDSKAFMKKYFREISEYLVLKK